MSQLDPRKKVVQPAKNKRAASKHSADESTKSFRAAMKAIGKPKPRADKAVKKLAKALHKDDPTLDRRPKD
jgi:hypothetical protein